MRKLLTTLTLLLAPTFSGAADLSYQFTGLLTSVTDQYGFLSGQFSPGNLISGIVTYESTTTEGVTSLGDPTFGIYAAIRHFRVSVNGYIIEGSPTSLPGYLQVWDDRVIGSSLVDAVTFGSPLDYTPPISGMGSGTVVASAQVNLFDFNHSASHNGKTLPTVIDYADYASRSFSALQLNINTNQVFHLNGSILTLTPVPEPDVQLLMALGLLFITCLHSKRKEA